MTDQTPSDGRSGLDGPARSGDPAWEAVFWDVGGVILDPESVRSAHRRFVADLCERFDAETAVEQALETWRTAVGRHFRERDGTEFRRAREGYAKGVAAVLGRDPPREEWWPTFEAAVGGAIEPVPGAVEAIETLADRDLHLGVISDVDADEGRRILDSFGVLDAFDSITTSEEVGRTKPDPAMFETALGKAKVAPERSLMVGDRYRHDVEGAADAGMRTAGLGTEDGPDLDYAIESPLEVVEIVDGEWVDRRS